MCRLRVTSGVLALLLGVVASAAGQQEAPSSPAVLNGQAAAPAVRGRDAGDSSPTVQAGRPLRIGLDRRTIVRRVGQEVRGTVLEQVYAYDRAVLPAGTKAIGHIAAIIAAPRAVRARAILGGDLTPPRHILVQFDTLVGEGGREIPVRTAASEGSGSVTLRRADVPERPGRGGASSQAAREAGRAVTTFTAPGKLDRLKDLSLRSLPYHPTFVPKGTVYAAMLLEPLHFDMGAPVERAPAGTAAEPDSVLDVRLLTALGSAATAAGTRVEAVLTQPVFASDHRLILPEGTRLTGEVTFAKPARRFHRNGQLRFLFQTIQVPDQGLMAVKASLVAVESAGAVVDDEGGTTIRSSPARFVAPGLAALALAGSLHGRLDYDTDGAGPETQYGNAASGSVAGLLGLSAAGVGLSLLGRTVTVTLAVAGVARTVYGTFLGKGRDVTFPANTVMQLQLAPGPTRRP